MQAERVAVSGAVSYTHLAIRPTVSAYMKDLDDELWSLGIPSKTKHNEVAPCQHELAPVYSELNLSLIHISHGPR